MGSCHCAVPSCLIIKFHFIVKNRPAVGSCGETEIKVLQSFKKYVEGQQ